MSWTLYDGIYLLTFIICGWIRQPHRKISQQTEVSQSYWDRLEKVTLGAVILGGMLLPVVYLLTPFLNFANQDISHWSGISGFMMALIGLWLFYRSHQDLGQQWSVSLEIRESHQLITKGIYEKIRHPMYSSIFLMSCSQWLLIGNWLVAPAYLIAFTVLYLIRIDKEEVMMLEKFGDAYVSYMKRTGRLFPKI